MRVGIFEPTVGRHGVHFRERRNLGLSSLNPLRIDVEEWLNEKDEADPPGDAKLIKGLRIPLAFASNICPVGGHGNQWTPENAMGMK